MKAPIFAVLSFAVFLSTGTVARCLTVVVDHQRIMTLTALQAQVWTMPPDMAAEYALSQRSEGLNDFYEYDVLHDFQGRYFSYGNGVRSTSWQPLNAPHTLWLFGASTLMQGNTPDDLTIASQLQRLVGPSYRVVNEGADALPTSHEAAKLRRVVLRSGDVVVFYDGVVNGINRTLTDYTSGLQDARAYAQSHGATFYDVLQPQLFSRPLTTFEQRLIDNLTDADIPQMASLKADWSAFQSANRAAGGIDLTHVLDALRDTMSVYLDYMHTGPQASPVIARALYDAMFPVY